MRLKIFAISALSVFLLTTSSTNVENKTCTGYEDYEWSQNCSIGNGANEVSNSKTSSNENESGAGGNDLWDVNNTGDVNNYNNNSAESDNGTNNPNESTSSTNG